MSTEMGPRQRYKTDAAYRLLVETMRSRIRGKSCSPSQLREAVDMAEVLEEMGATSPAKFSDDDETNPEGGRER